MATPLKDYYNDSFFDYFVTSFLEVHPTFDGKKFKKDIYKHNWLDLELKERMRHSADVLAKYLPKDFKKSSAQINAYIDHWHASNKSGFGFQLLFLADFVERYGLDDVESAIDSLEKITTVSSAEFAVRPFLSKYPERMMEQMSIWSHHKNEHVRRLSSEGFRPRLPWGLAVTHLKKDPSKIFDVLETLKNDPSEYVRRSVANNINDISKDHPELVIELLTRWKSNHPETEKIVKHASRTLLKRGNLEVLTLFGAGSSKNISFEQLEELTPEININDSQTFSFQIHYSGKAEQKVRLEYVVYFQLKSGEFGRKVFFISEKTLAENQSIHINKKHSFKPITTRTYYQGTHKIGILVNGKEYAFGEFVLNL